ncbi:5-methyltetrahydropteroyltriglutamate--homocysteine S-methyltransferase [Flavobacterium johnsoniae]|uniref:5-methyltetrahydropteroyltriglutamate--homocysteine methyltransferase n=1 Tax=Flavobacterium johnsoniae (strain ATCC 17061 / DSM 2064 / JCM 8514 / BCRC 14874 / CCUG 350202 / NBRC 14942 / NCIMB 11054 / UW101) TaxID=376686 RepID=METE_FLAJ1|nr:5-methyltetrahydropteroyltriglutamate--homocysteine S-methyltransferase [Flavobacterium johnsoniae]A5FJR8.1 RecName: Full=5-methyltetrahydropteroyltriglutamate--homocysteine methyltransferase; AltName: Full=Cobalamin-independent methionine synthase; AltName: Full=Methionine synthase, vitamin-B12 independent isozyme [Flavobacterium johnsoniae UW101]ABQ04551.1 methionine synthase (B12-independent) [Flavobacterium johnsoniae UW101]OXE97875.1 5-methyltetrahydropteroyltriglutamate--homocysteine me
MKTNNLGYPRIGSNRELKKASELYWAGKISADELLDAGKEIRLKNWYLQSEAGVDLIPSNDFSFYDQVLDLTLAVGAIPQRYHELAKSNSSLDLYFAMARGSQKNGQDVVAMEMTKWFDTNYHYIVPEFTKNQKFELFSEKILNEFKEANAVGIKTKPVLIGPVSYLLLGKEKEEGFNRIDLIDALLPVYFEILEKLQIENAEYIQLDEPFLALNLTDKERNVFTKVYNEINVRFPKLKIVLANYFDCFGENLETALALPVDTFHLDLVRCQLQLDDILESGKLASNVNLSLGVVDGRNIWKNDFKKSLELIKKAADALGENRILLAPSCSLIHSPCDLDLETNDQTLTPEIKQWLAFAKQKINEVVLLKQFASGEVNPKNSADYERNVIANENRKTSKLIHNNEVKARTAGITAADDKRKSAFASRRKSQIKALNLPLFPTTTIGSFPQTTEVRSWRAKFKKGELTTEQYNDLIEKETEAAIRFQEETGIDVLVHGEFERNDMVEYFGEQLDGFTFTKNGWVQSYGSRCVKPPVIYGDVSRPNPMTVKWSKYAQSLTSKWVKGMLTGPVTILQWSFVRNDQPRSETCTQIALAVRDEVVDLEKAGIKIIQIDEPAIREGLPLRKEEWAKYLDWAVKAFRISASGVNDDTQIHPHMCYSEFNDIIQNIADMDADVITIECSRSQMELLDAFANFKYPNEIGPGVYDIHSPRVPSSKEMVRLLEKASAVIPVDQLWVNPDCGLKTRHWNETKKALIEMVAAAQEMRKAVENPVTE